MFRRRDRSASVAVTVTDTTVYPPPPPRTPARCKVVAVRCVCDRYEAAEGEGRATERPPRRVQQSSVPSQSVVKRSAARHVVVHLIAAARRRIATFSSSKTQTAAGTPVVLGPLIFSIVSNLLPRPSFYRPACREPRHEVQLVTRVRGVRRRDRDGVRGQPTATVRPGGDAAQRSENRIRVHVGRMRAQVQDQRHAYHALHRQTGGRHQVRL